MIKAENEITLVRVDDGEEGANGTTFYPSVSSEGVISWTNDGEKPNPEPVVIKGPQGISLNSVTRYYKLSDTTPTDYPPSTGWQTSEPAYTPGDAKNLYICDLFAWSNSTVTASEISLSSSYEAAKQAYNAAQGALTAANGKNTIFHQSTQPTGGTYKVGDTWFDTDDGYKMYTYNGTNWVAEQLGANAIADLAITNAKIANGTIQNAKIATIDAGKITTGTLDANRIAANSLTIGKIATADQAQILNSNVLVGGRNLFADSNNIGNLWGKNNAVVEGGVATLNADATGETRIYQLPADGYWVWTANTEYVVSIDAKASSNGAVLKFVANGGSSKTKEVALTTEWKRYTFEFKTTASVSTASMTFSRKNVGASIDLRQPKLELGNKATDWSPAPEDMADVDSVNELTATLSEHEESIVALEGNVEDIDGNVSSISTNVASLQTTTTSIKAQADKELVSSGYAKITTTPSLELGRNSSDWKVIITNQSIDLAKAGAVGATLSPNPERTNETLFRIDTTRLANLYFRSANGQGKLGIVAQSNGHISLKEI